MTLSTVTFETEIGRCAIRWTTQGVSGVLLPTAHPRPAQVAKVALPAFVADAIDGITATMVGAACDLRGVPLDERGIDDLRRAVYAATRQIPVGATRSYGEVARSMGRVDPLGAREVGAALATNPFPIIVPCHRVVAANGALHGFSAPGGLATKRRMLELEGAPGYGQQVLFG